MSKQYMKVAGEVIILEVSKSSDYGYLFLGFVTDGEWNSLRTKGTLDCCQCCRLVLMLEQSIHS